MATIDATVTGSLWKLLVAPGDTVAEGDTVAILEAMKMEMPVEAEYAGTVSRVLKNEGDPVREGEPLVELE
ncbi:acetyl-CoA carboxylase biotin carboxyl carrier protein subunit [Sporichthya sp.]|uniref:acetyl-CoA carboxylase biotin carboxyl carrier protein subunit n=1 Tax=Sporichthya sp. TaxID=65475 RepID=UPI00185057F4|nr:acetyl-CoA carboxylase biotin carboxyl carrier protein subunit [Sporichthya sp.]MBA3741526.1 acetyl-CoA carboxylase biotin carboxyl carrier protein subunit [Sporichthya sp.]